MSEYDDVRRALDAAAAAGPALQRDRSAAVAARIRAHRRRRRLLAGQVAVVTTALALVWQAGATDPPTQRLASGDGSPSASESPYAGPSPAEATPRPSPVESESASPMPEPTSATSPADGRPTPPADGPPRTEHVELPSGTRLTVTVDPSRTVTAREVAIRVRVEDADGTWNGGEIGFGDGRSHRLPRAVADCVYVTSPPARPAAPSDRSETFRHAYRGAGRFQITVAVLTDRACDAAPAEELSVTVPVDVAAGPAPANGPAAVEVDANERQWSDDAPDDEVAVQVRAVDADGWVTRIAVDWGDGSAPTTLDFGLADCEEPRGYWPSSERRVGETEDEPGLVHAYADPGDYTVTVTAVSTGCDGSDRQAGSTRLSVTAY